MAERASTRLRTGTLKQQDFRKLCAAGKDSDDESLESEAAPASSDEDEPDPDKLYCVCQSPDDGRFMLACDGCDNWFHPACVGMTKREAEALEDYLCKDCNAIASSLMKGSFATAAAEATVRPSSKRKLDEATDHRLDKRAAKSQSLPKPMQARSKRKLCEYGPCRNPVMPGRVFCSNECEARNAELALSQLFGDSTSSSNAAAAATAAAAAAAAASAAAAKAASRRRLASEREREGHGGSALSALTGRKLSGDEALREKVRDNFTEALRNRVAKKVENKDVDCEQIAHELEHALYVLEGRTIIQNYKIKYC
jgi:hypothetical protein